MKILLIGASSYLGARLYVDLKKDFDVTGTYLSNKLSDKFVHLDITDKGKTEEVISTFKHDVVIHCANFPKIEGAITQELGKKVNLEATAYVVESCSKNKAKLVFVSSVSSYSTDNLYGLYKKQSEEIVKTSKSGWLIVQPPYILGYSPNTKNDRPFNRIYKNIFEGSPAVYDNSWRTPLCYIGQISETIKTCLNRNIWNQTIPLGTAEKKSRFEMARDILKNFAIETKPIDKKDATFSATVDLSAIIKLGLPDYSYEEIVTKIVNDIKDKDSFLIT